MKIFLLLGGLLAGLAVILGAFAAHGLKKSVTESLLKTFQTGVEYQFLHALALILIFILAKQFPQSLWAWSAGSITIGVILFSGSLYGLVLAGAKWLGPVTPIGGLAFIVGWILFVIAATKAV